MICWRIATFEKKLKSSSHEYFAVVLQSFGIVLPVQCRKQRKREFLITITQIDSKPVPKPLYSSCGQMKLTLETVVC